MRKVVISAHGLNVLSSYSLHEQVGDTSRHLKVTGLYHKKIKFPLKISDRAWWLNQGCCDWGWSRAQEARGDLGRKKRDFVHSTRFSSREYRTFQEHEKRVSSQEFWWTRTIFLCLSHDAFFRAQYQRLNLKGSVYSERCVGDQHYVCVVNPDQQNPERVRGFPVEIDVEEGKNDAGENIFWWWWSWQWICSHCTSKVRSLLV